MTNIELVNKLYEHFASNNLEGLKSVCSDDIKWKQNPGFPGGGINTGAKDILKNVRDGNASRWKSFSFRKDRVTGLGNIVLVEGAYIVQSKKSGKSVEAQTCHVFEILNNKVISFQQYTDSKTLWDNYEPAIATYKL